MLIIMVKNKTVSRQVGDFLSHQLTKINIKSKVEMVTWPSLLDRAQKGRFTIFYLAWFTGLPDAFEFYEIIYGPNYPGSYNRVGFQHENFDKLFKQGKNQRNISKQNKIIRKMNDIVQEELPILPLVHAKTYFIHHGWLKNYVPSETYGGLEQYYDIDLKAKRRILDKL